MNRLHAASAALTFGPLCAVLHLANATRAAVAVFVMTGVLIAWLLVRERGERPVVVRKVRKVKVNKKRRKGLDRNGWPREI